MAGLFSSPSMPTPPQQVVEIPEPPTPPEMPDPGDPRRKAVAEQLMLRRRMGGSRQYASSILSDAFRQTV